MYAEFWTDEKTAGLKELFGKGLSYSQIGKELGTTRNSVASKCQREGLSRGRVVTARLPVVAAPKDRRVRIKKFRWTPIETRVVTTKSRVSVPLLELGEGCCHFSVDEKDGRHLFCGEVAAVGEDREVPYPYCAKHCKIVYRPTGPLDPQAEAR